MTDSNADDADGQRTNLSRRAAVTLLGTAAVGGTAATGAFSQLTADRPIEVDVVDSSAADSQTSANNTSSSLRIRNNVNDRINATIAANNFENVSMVGLNNTDVSLNGTTNANITSTNQSWELTEIRPGETVEVKFQQNTTSPSADVTFDVEAFSDTNGYSIGSDRAVSVATPTTGVSRWPLSNYNIDYSGNTRINDVWNDNAGSIENGNPSPARGPNGTGDALYFDGSDSVEIPASSELELSNLSVSAWVKPDVLPNNMSSGAPSFFGHREDSDVRFSLHATGNSELTLYDGDQPTFSVNWGTRWIHMVVTSNGTDYEVFVDGSSVATGGDGTPGTATANLHIGSSGNGTNELWEGSISDVRYYDKALSSSEVTSLYNNGHI